MYDFRKTMEHRYHYIVRLDKCFFRGDIIMDKIRILILVIGIIVIIGFSIYSFKGTTPTSQPEGTQIKPIGQATITPSPDTYLNHSLVNTSTSNLKSYESVPAFHYISFSTNLMALAGENASNAESSSMVMNIFANKDLPENFYSISFPQATIVTHGKNPGSFVAKFQNLFSSIDLQDIPDDTNVNLYMLTVAKPNLNMLPDYKELSSNQFKIDNNRAYDIKYTWSNSSEKLETLKTFIEGKDQAAVVTFSGPVQDYIKNNSTLNSILHSFKWLGP